MNSLDAEELMLQPTGRVSAIPVDPRYNEIWKHYELQQGNFWPHNKVSFDGDAKYFDTAPQHIRDATLKVLGYFAQSDEIVERIIKRSRLGDITIPEIQHTYDFEAMMENIHSTVYNRNIVAYVHDTKQREELFHAVDTMPCVAKKAEWATQWITDTRSLDYTIIGKACVEAINFSSSFAWIDWLKTQKYKFNGMFLANDEISRDENAHVTTGILLHSLVRHKLSHDSAKEIIDGAIAVENAFVQEVVPKDGLSGMTQRMMMDHVRHCASRLSTRLGYKNMYPGTSCPFDLNIRSVNYKTNFFEKHGTEYNVMSARARDTDDLSRAFDADARW